MRKMGRFLRKHAIEAAVVVVVIAILFTVMVQPFLKAQSRARAVRAMHDLERIAKAMQTLELVGVVIDVVYLEGEKEGGVWHTGPRGVAFSKMVEMLGEIPVPIRTASRPGMVASPGRYEVASGVGRINSNVLQLIPRMENCAMQSYNFSQITYRSRVGASFGPFYDESHILRLHALGRTNVARPPSLNFLDSITPSPSYFASYDPTNGVMSHGFIVLITDKGPPLTPQARRLEDELVRQRMRLRNNADALWMTSNAPTPEAAQ